MYILPQLSTNEKKKMTSQKQSKIGSSGALPHPMQAGSMGTDRRGQSADSLRNSKGERHKAAAPDWCRRFGDKLLFFYSLQGTYQISRA